ncbi:MAG: hypothetical protein QM635_12310, partial [Microbacteriaceae bacterium]
VSTDDGRIARAARAAGARIVLRPAALAADTAGSEPALLHALEAIDPDGRDYGILAFLQATSPFIAAADLDAAIARVAAGEADSVLAATPSHAFLWRLGPHGAVGVNHDETRRLRRQDAEPQYRETGAFYVLRTDGLRERGHRFVGRIGLQLVDGAGALEIDDPADLELAEAIAPLVDARAGGTVTGGAVVTGAVATGAESGRERTAWSPSAAVR